MTEYRFSLQKYKRGTKLSCPNCGKKQCFVKYIDNQGEITFPDYVGRCDHEQSCKYLYTPSDYFKDNPMLIDYGKHSSIKASNLKPCLPPPTSFIDNELMERSLTNYAMNPLYIYLSGALAKMRHSGYSNCIMLELQRNGEVLRFIGKLIGKATCEQERLCCMIEQQDIG